MSQYSRLNKGYDYLQTLRKWYGEFRPHRVNPYMGSGMTAKELADAAKRSAERSVRWTVGHGGTVRRSKP